METWLKLKDIVYPERCLKIELLRIINSVREKYISYEVDELAKERNVIVCQSPPYHCELNAIEMENWASCDRHTQKVEEEMWKTDELQDNAEPLIIRLTSNSSSSGNQSSQSGSEEGSSRPSKTNRPSFERIQELSDSDVTTDTKGSTPLSIRLSQPRAWVSLNHQVDDGQYQAETR
ncbi:hypothetical protein J437_LFUL010252 [Ladona fulva]|uniref:Uncharacterized protein n=1 Tax=Ladona fulva TaxID=123851 RepID=A0A8K0K9K8_LADFU|nr:hypothetical protein J437_LFUL010252 [Ladona fulva]